MSQVDITELKKLVGLMNSKELTLLITDQLCDEFVRNRENKINDAIEKHLKKNSNFKVNLPTFCKGYTEYADLKNLHKELNKLHSAIIQKASEDAKKGSFDADEIVGQLLTSATKIGETDDIYDAAWVRFHRGNPPGKNSRTIGDQIHWESLLSEIPEGDDIHIISEDKDFRSALDPNSLSQFLVSEWESKKKSKAHFYPSLPDFLSTHYKEITLENFEQANLLIGKLAASGSFATTHACINGLLELENFTSKQLDQLVFIAETNHQVGWIITDTDVHEFYSAIKETSKSKKLKDLVSRIENLINAN